MHTTSKRRNSAVHPSYINNHLNGLQLSALFTYLNTFIIATNSGSDSSSVVYFLSVEQSELDENHFQSEEVTHAQRMWVDI